MDVKIESGWKEVLKEEFDKPYFKSLAEFVKNEYATGTVYPPPHYIFSAFDSSPIELTKVVILGQDPYHGAGQAHGLSFSVPDGVTPPPSLVNIYKEIESDTGIKLAGSGNLTRWAKQGVLLLNATLTVRGGSPGSHQGKGWEEFTDAAIKYLNQNKENLVFLLWGAYAQKRVLLLIEQNIWYWKPPTPHPSPPTRAFSGVDISPKPMLTLFSTTKNP